MKAQPPNQNDRVWETLFQQYEILEKIEQEGKFILSIEQIRECQESKVLTKFDHKNNLPEIFKKNQLGILPISIKEYVISHINNYQPIEIPKKKTQNLIRITYPPYELQSFQKGSILSETLILQYAFASGILTDFLEEEQIYPTISKQIQIGSFSFQIRNEKLDQEIELEVCNTPIELDAAFESKESLTLIKINRDLSEDFLIQNIYYPYRAWTDQIKKRVRLVFLIYSNGVFHLYEYEFCNPNQYHSLSFLRQKAYVIEDTNITQMDLNDVWVNVNLCEEPKIALPQAEYMERVINLCELLQFRTMNRDQLIQQYDFDIKQANGYTTAARYLGLIQLLYPAGKKPIYILTKRGEEIMKMGYCQRQLELCRCILRHRVFHELFGQTLKFGKVPKQWLIIARMHKANLYQMDNPKTYEWRASTISGWLQWILNLFSNEKI